MKDKQFNEAVKKLDKIIYDENKIKEISKQMTRELNWKKSHHDQWATNLSAILEYLKQDKDFRNHYFDLWHDLQFYIIDEWERVGII